MVYYNFSSATDYSKLRKREEKEILRATNSLIQAKNILGSQISINVQDFQILKVIGRGSFGKVFLVRKNDGQNNFYAMKVYRKETIVKRNLQMKTQGNLSLFLISLGERDILEKIKSPFIV